MLKLNWKTWLREYKTPLAFILLLGIIVLPFLAQAQETQGPSYPFGLIPCGNKGQDPCTLNDLITLADKVINFLLFRLAIPLAILSMMIGGILMLTARGDQKQLQQGKDVFYYAVLGFVVAFGAYLIVETIITTLTGKSDLTAWLKGLGIPH